MCTERGRPLLNEGYLFLWLKCPHVVRGGAAQLALCDSYTLPREPPTVSRREEVLVDSTYSIMFQIGRGGPWSSRTRTIICHNSSINGRRHLQANAPSPTKRVRMAVIPFLTDRQIQNLNTRILYRQTALFSRKNEYFENSRNKREIVTSLQMNPLDAALPQIDKTTHNRRYIL